jgi:hypothetical protein
MIFLEKDNDPMMSAIVTRLFESRRFATSHNATFTPRDRAHCWRSGFNGKGRKVNAPTVATVRCLDGFPLPQRVPFYLAQNMSFLTGGNNVKRICDVD